MPLTDNGVETVKSLADTVVGEGSVYRTSSCALVDF